ncbi:DUF6345 domain-containing protein [Actinoplanes sp. NBRC 103695]|uniref:DUF6345 domain-containing protein n=1 Tax=Actinoplanes sp. NBRC 103695 TaxID=3032202 RepID=UPI0024A44EA4|nr:DUF6345 domain-containing protein [Actinoplanes sp. NBRC 103695]GLZ01402.1 hypothetical protein Acsp02_86530 [Actinoplanes sp. NBRC 103695]
MGKRHVLIGVAVLAAPLAVIAPPPVSAAARSLPVFTVRSAGLSQAQAAALGRAFGLRNVDRSADGAVRFMSTSGFLAVPTKAGPRGVDEDGNATTAALLDLAALKRVRTLNSQVALARTAKALAGAKLVPAGGRAKASNTTVQTVDRRGRTTADVKIDTTVSYARTLAGLPYEGPGAKVRVGYDGNGAVTSLFYGTRDLAQTGTVPVLDAAGSLQRCARFMGTGVKVTSATPYYFAAPLSTRLTRLEPSLRCAGVDAGGNATQTVTLPATVNATLPTVPADPQPPRPRVAPQDRAYKRVDVGSEGTGVCSGLPNTKTNLASFNNAFTSRNIPVEFSWSDANAWEQDFKDPSKGGDDSNYADHVDMAYWQGHGSPTGFSFSGCSSNDDTKLSNTDARWGNGDVEWMSLFTCLILEGTSGGKAWWQRWGPAFDGLHQINSFHTVSKHSSDHGVQYATYLLRSNPLPVRKAWAAASIDDQPSDVVWANMGVIGANGSVTMNDYFWNRGPVGPDIPASAVTGYWYLRGIS